MMDIQHVANRIQALAPRPRERQWSSLTYCVLDAVWSIGANYNSVVVPLVARVAAEHGAPGTPALRAPGETLPDPLSLHAFLAAFPTEERLVAETNRQRTSSRGGITKAAAARQYAEAFVSHGVSSLVEAEGLLRDPSRLDCVDAALREVPGEGADGIRRGYLWMLIGNDDAIKPDRMVMRWLNANGAPVKSPEAARLVLAQVAEALGGQYTLWEIDHAIWQARVSTR